MYLRPGHDGEQRPEKGGGGGGGELSDGLPSPSLPSSSAAALAVQDPSSSSAFVSAEAAAAALLLERERQAAYDQRLAHAIWARATTGANPAVDLLVCLERRRAIGFRYADIARAVVIHHGSRDTRVPVDTVRWLGKAMRRCEVRVLPGEGHGLMARGAVMGGVLMEIAREWDDWTKVVQHARGGGDRGGFGGSGDRGAGGDISSAAVLRDF
jgi:pimeloyl-ACP methyl ester carboxylesterase